MYSGSDAVGRKTGYRNTFTSHDPDEVHHHISTIFKPHDLKVLGKQQAVNATVGWTDFGDISFLYVHHGADVNVYTGKLETFYLLQVPLNAAGQVRIDSAVMDISNKMSYVVSPTFDVDMKFARNCDHFILKIERARLERFLEKTLQRSLSAPLEFAPRIDMKTGRSREFIRMLSQMASELGQASSSLRHDLIRPQAEALILGTMLINLDHNYHAELTAEVATPRPYYIKKAQDYIHEHAECAITPEDIAREACISLRSIYTGFQSYLNTTPMAYIKDVKLRRIHEELVRLDPSEASVSDIALKYGFGHFGNFAADYKKRFGELPSETLRRKCSLMQ